MIKTHSCLTVACNVCGDPFPGDVEDYEELHFDTIAEARTHQDPWGDEYKWIIQDDGYALCAEDDESHRSVRETLEPTAPQQQVPGQVELTETGGARTGNLPNGPCPECSCCVASGCHAGPGSLCPTDALGDPVCPCTGGER